MAETHGGQRPGAGRKVGGANRATRDQKGYLARLAQTHTEAAVKTLAQVMRKGESEAARVSAAIHLLDRGYGKPMQAHQHTGAGGGPIAHVDLTKATDDQLAALEALFGPLAAAGGDDAGDPGGEDAAGG